MENQIQENTPIVQPLPQVPVLPSTNWLKILSFILLGLLVISGAIFVGIQIGKKQLSNQKPTVTTIPTSTIANPTPSNSDTTNQKSKSSCQIIMNEFSDSNSNHNFDLTIEESSQNNKCKLINNSIGYSLIINNDWRAFPSGAISSPAIELVKSSGIDKNKEQLYTLIITRDIASNKSIMDIENAEKTIIAGEGGNAPLINKFQDIIEKKVITIGNYQVLDLTTTYNTVQKTGKNNDYTKTYIILDKFKGSVYQFILNSYKPKFDNSESLETIKATKEIISSFELI